MTLSAASLDSTSETERLRARVIELTRHDAKYVPSENPGAIEAFVRKLIIDPRDLPFVSLLTQVTFFLIPAAAALFVLREVPWWLGLAYLLFNAFVFIDRFILMHHNVIHRPLFRSHVGWMNHLVPWVFAPFHGITPETYSAHHIGMHHPENNLPPDLSSTMKYQRDSVFGFLAYYLRFVTLSIVELAQYFSARKKYTRMRKLLVGEFSFLALVVGLSFYSLSATLWVFIAPFMMVRFLMMAGNWAQHAFVDANAPGNCHRNSITCVNARYNRRAFNDGYHIAHHLKAAMHWTELPGELVQNFDKYIAERAVVFRDTDFFAVWLMLMTKQYKTLAKHYVVLDGRDLSEDEIVALLKERTRRIDIHSAPEAVLTPA